MAGCEVDSPGSDASAGVKRVFLGWGGVGALIGEAAASTAAGGFAFWPFVLGALDGYVLGVAIGYAVEWFTRLKEQTPRTITLNGHLVCAGKNTGLPPFNDNDWTFNLGPNPAGAGTPTVLFPTGLGIVEVMTRAAPGSGLAHAFASQDPNTHEAVLHCEIGSHIGDFAAAGTAIGAAAGAVAGGLIGAAIGCTVLGIFTFGIACLIAILVGILIGAIVGAFAGDLVGSGVGWIADQVSDFDKKGESVEKCCVVNFTGRWVTDIGHQHNEIHNIESMQIIECGPKASASGLTGAVGIGRMPTGRDP
jgi:hypothetical protein